MTMIISGDHLGRFAELDHSVIDELRVILEAREQSSSTTSLAAAIRGALHATTRGLRWFGDWQDRSAHSA